MSHILDGILEIPNLIDSKRVADKKKCISELLLLFENKEAIEEISKHSESKNDASITWWNIFTIIHKLILWEADRLATKDVQGTNKARFDTCAILLNTIHYSDKCRIPTLKCAGVIKRALQIFHNRSCLPYCDTYLTILTTYILPVQLYCISISSEQWKELLSTCIDLYEQEASMLVDNCTIIKALQMIVQHGYVYCNLLLEMKKLLPLLRNILSNLKILQRIEELIYQLANTICYQLATENRIILCQFSEDILPKIIDSNSCNEKYKFMSLCIQIHHPKGVQQENDGAFACNWDKWNGILWSMYNRILEDWEKEISFKDFPHFASEVFNQVLQNPGTRRGKHNSSNSYSPRGKRRCVAINGPVDLLHHDDLMDAWPTIQILTILFAKYPERVQPDDFIPLLTILDTYLTQSCKVVRIINSLYDMCTVLMEIEQLSLNDSKKTDSTNTHWYNIWNILLRSLNTNQCEVSAHRLAQCFIKYGKIRSTNSLFTSYMSQTISWSPSSMRTLIMCCEHTPLPDIISIFETNRRTLSYDTRSVKLCFIEWLLNIPWFKFPSTRSIDSLCNILIGIPAKFFQEKNTTLEKPNLLQNYFLHEDSGSIPHHKIIESCNLAHTFQTNLFIKPTTETYNSQEHLQVSFLKANINMINLRNVLEILKKYLYDIVDETNKDNDICSIIMKIALVCKVTTMVKRMNILVEDAEIRSIMCVIENCLQHVYSLLQITERCQGNYKYLIDLTNAFLILYETFCHTYADMAKILVSLSTPEKISNLFNLLNIADDDQYSYHEICKYNDNFDIFQKEIERSNENQATYKYDDIMHNLNIIKIQTVRTLAVFCCINTGKERYQIQLDLMRNLTTIDNFDFALTIDFKMAITMLESLIRYDKEMLYEKYEDTPILFLLDLFNRCKKDAKYVCCILRILPYFVKYAASNDYDLTTILDALCDLCSLLSSNKFGPFVHIEFLKHLSEIIEIKPLLMKHRQYTQYQEKLWYVIENSLTYIKNPLYVLRLQALDCVQKLYSSKSVEYERKVCFFDKLKEAAVNLLSDEIRSCETDDIETRTTSVLLVFATIIRSSIDDAFKNTAFIVILELTDNNRYIKLEAAQKVLRRVAKQAEGLPLDEDNLACVLSYWLTTNHTTETFPWMLTQYSSQKEFYKTRINTLVFAEIKNFHFANAKELCICADYLFKDVFENIFATVLSWLLSSICLERTRRSSSDEVERALNILHELTSNQGNFEDIDTFSDLFETNFDKVIVNVIQKLHDEEDFHKMFQLRCQFPRANPPILSKADVDGCLRYMEKHFMSSKSFLHYLANRGISKLQKILLNLSSNIYDMKFTEHKLKALHQYIYFCTIAMEGLKFDYFDAISAYLVREITYTLIHLINKNDIEVLSETACKYFHAFLKCILPKRCVQVKDHLNYIVTSLVPVAQIRKLSTALDILEYLIIEQKELLSDAIAKLNVFPSLPKFQRIWKIHNALKYEDGNIYGLEKEIRHFLDATDHNITTFSLESLSFLKLQLSTKRNELQEMYDKLDDSDTIGNHNLLHRLIRKLLGIIRSSDQTISIEATKCLGQLGPIELGATILPHEESNLYKEGAKTSDILTYNVITLLTDFLVDSDIKLRVASANALNAILSSVWGEKIVNKKNCLPVQWLTSTDHPRPALRIDYIIPFINQESSLMRKEKIILDKVSCNKYINAENIIWTEESCINYDEWIVRITCNIIECFSGYFLKDLIPVCKLSVEMCESILPRIIFLIMYMNEELAVAMCHCIDRFFHHHFGDTNQSSLHDSQSSISQRNVVCCDRNTVCLMLNLVNFIRTSSNDNVPLQLDFICVAKAARYCSAYFTALLYAEMSCESLLIESCNFSNIPKIDYVCEHEPILGKTLQNILINAYTKIGDPDATRGCGSSHLQDRSSRVQYYTETHEWYNVLVEQDIELSSGNKTAIGEMIVPLLQLGLYHLLGHTVSTMNVSTTKEATTDVQLECAWRLSNWDIPLFHRPYESNKKLQLSASDYHFYHFNALRCFHEKDESGVNDAIERARTCITKTLANINSECNKEIYQNLTQLQMLSEIEELCLTESDNYSRIFQKWQRCNVANLNEFRYTEPILTQRSVMYRINDALCDNPIVKTELVNTYIEIAEVAQNQGHLQIAARALGTLAKQTDLSSRFRDLLDYQESLLAWKQNHYELGRCLLRNLIHKTSIDPILQARALRIYGDWMVETKSENPQTVIEKYYEKSIEISASEENRTSVDATKNLYDAQVAMARFADAQFERVKAYMKSPQFTSFKKCVEYSRNTVKVDSSVRDTDLRRAAILNQKQSTNDIAELQNIEKEKGRYLLTALRYYILTLCHSNDYNSLVFRLVALWLENANNKEVNKLLNNNFDQMPSFKFIPLIPQLAAHTNNVSDDFSVNVNKILMRCALDHPHHTLPVLLALKNLYGDYEFSKTKRNTKGEEPRVLGAKQLLKQLHASNVAPIIKEMERLSHALVMLANYDSDKSKRGTMYEIPAGQEILKIKNFSRIFVPTLTVDVKCNGEYDNVISIARYTNAFETVGGVNAPKKIVCIGTDGIKREQLLKGKDDLRQDSVMQQVFNVMNGLFRTSKNTKRRKLKIRTYKVVPLTQRSGILEWCENTIPIAAILTGPDGNSGLHKKYNPQDYSAITCRKKMDEVSQKSNSVRLQQFLECCKRMRPVFHRFFFEKYPSPVTWYEKRLAYTRSVATTSIAGYILGLGDRHLSNILMDESTAELVHIDFGIAFEQGKVLPVPETVPFRLTRDMEVAMGICGVEGIMRRACEEILTVLRDQKQTIITLLQVLLYDPLFTWTLTPAKAHSVQSGNAAVSSEDVKVHKTNTTAERALLRIEQKLQGTEEGLVISVPGQVEQLLQQARDPSNLSRLFSGWQPYL